MFLYKKTMAKQSLLKLGEKMDRRDAIYSHALELAQAYDGSEASYHAFMDAAIAVDAEGFEADKVDGLLDIAIQAVQNVNREEDFLSKLERGGAKIFHHGAVFVRPDLTQRFNEAGEDAKPFENPVFEPRLREVVMALQGRGIFFDDLVIDVGRVNDNQMRKWPYVIVTIPRLNVQIAVADQKGEAMYVANPAIDFMNWALFQKPMAGQAGTIFENMKRVVHAGAWEEKLLGYVFGDDPAKPPKVNLDGWVKAQRKSKYPLTEEMVVEMAKMWRAHPDNKYKYSWPSHQSGKIPRDIILKVTGDENWKDETWGALHYAGIGNIRGLTRGLRPMLDAHRCHYNLTEHIVVAMARLWRERHPQKQWPSLHSGSIPRDIIVAVTGDEHWQDETWRAIDAAGSQNSRGLTRSLRQILDAHGCHYNLTEDMVVAMARLWRERHPQKQWPNAHSGLIPRDIIITVTGDENWQDETWGAIDGAGSKNNRGLTRSLRQIFDDHGCHYNLTEDMVFAIAPMFR